jgi:hypothetical protein
VLAALATSIERAERHGARVARMLDAVGGAIGTRQPFVLVDEDEIRFEIGRSHAHALPFTERDGLFNGLPADDAAALAELRRLRARGAERLVVWKDSFWVLDYYQELGAHLRTRCPVVVSTPDVQIFDLDAASGGLAP